MNSLYRYQSPQKNLQKYTFFPFISKGTYFWRLVCHYVILLAVRIFSPLLLPHSHICFYRLNTRFDYRAFCAFFKKKFRLPRLWQKKTYFNIRWHEKDLCIELITTKILMISAKSFLMPNLFPFLVVLFEMLFSFQPYSVLV